MSAWRSGTASAGRLFGAEFWLHAAVMLASVALMYVVLGLGQADLHVPFSYGTDGLFTGTMIKSGLASGSFFLNPALGAPGGMNLLDYPSADGASYLLLRAIGCFTHDWAVVMNLFFLLGFPLAAAAALYSFRRLGLGRWLAASLALLFAYAPFHLMRGEGHLFLAAIYVVPLACLLVVESAAGRSPFLSPDSQGKPRLALRTRSSLVAAVMLLAIGSSGVYYAYFTLCFVVLAALIAWWRERSSAHLASGAVAVGVLATSVLLSVLPFIAYRLSAGSNPSALERGAMGVEAYALRITQMLMPVPGHRIPVFARLTAMYTSSMRGVFGANVINENSSAAIGAVAAFGFLVLVAVVLGGSRRAAAKGDDRLWAAGSLSLAGILAATASGLGFFVGMALPQIRAYNRISIFLAFFSLFAAGYVLERALGRLRPTLRAGALPVVAFVLLAIGLFDQTTPAMVPAYAATAVAYRADELFVAQVERALPAGSTVLQLPYVPFPENPPVNKMLDYEHFKGYLHSAALKWSYGAVKGRAGAAAIAALSTMPVAQLVVSARSDGYAGIWVDREGYADGGVALVQGIAAATQAQPLISSDGRYVVFALQ